MNFFDSLYVESRFTAAECSGLSAKQLRQLAQYIPGVTSIPEKLFIWLNERKIKPVDQTFFLTLADDVDSAKVTGVNAFEEKVFAKNGDTLHSKDKTLLIFADGTKKEVRNGIIPVPPEIELRVEALTLAEVTCAAFDVTEGKVEQIVNQAVWRERFNTVEVALDVTALPQCKAVTESIVQLHPAWGNVRKDSKTIHGPQFFKFFLEAIYHCNWELYFAAHTTWATRFFKYAQVIRVDNRTVVNLRHYVNSEGKQVPYLPPDCCVMVGSDGVTGVAKDAYNKIFDKYGLAPILLKGPFKTPQNFPGPGFGVLDEAYKAYQLGNSFRGGEKRGLACMASSVGFTALQSVNVKRMLTLLSIAIPLLKDEDEVQIYCKISDVVLLNNSIQHFVSGAKFLLTVPEGDYYKLDDKTRLLVSQQVVRSAIAIRYLEQSVPSVGTTSSAKTVLDKAAADYIAISEKGHDLFVSVCPIVSDVFFSPSYQVACFRSPWDFVGILTNLTGKLSQAVSDDKLVARFRDFPIFKTFSKFLQEVISSNARMNVLFLNKVVHFSPVTNLLVPPKKGYSAILSTDGELQYTHVVDSGYLASKSGQDYGVELTPKIVSIDGGEVQERGTSASSSSSASSSQETKEKRKSLKETTKDGKTTNSTEKAVELTPSEIVISNLDD